MNQLCKVVCVSGYVLSQSMVVLSATPEQVESARQLQEQQIESLTSTSPVEVRDGVSHITVNHGVLMSPVVTQGDKTDQKHIEKFKYKTEPSGITYVPYRVLSFLYALKSDKVWIGAPITEMGKHNLTKEQAQWVMAATGIILSKATYV